MGTEKRRDDMTEAPKVTIRRATKDDADAIFLVLQACDSEIPINLDDDDFKRYIRDKIRVACLGGQTCVAVSGNQVIGFLLALPLSFEERWFELTYAGVLKNYRGNGLFPQMLHEIKVVARRIDATVKNANQSGMAGRLQRAGFSETKPSLNDERSFEWLAQAPLHEG
jgi:N-acetylglutamate synthase-like GNAT family acetyltransferase